MKKTTLKIINGFERRFQSNRNLLLLLLFILIILKVNTGAIQESEYALSNDKIKLSIDNQGRLLKLENLKTGHNYLASSGNVLWKMYYRTSDARELEIPAEKQKAKISRNGNKLEISYSELTGNVALATSSRQLKIEFRLSVRLEADQLIWTASIKNNETEPELEVSELWIPFINGIGNLGKGREADQLLWPEDGGRRITNPFGKLSEISFSTTSPGRTSRAYQMTYPWPACMQWFALSNGEETMYMGSHDQSLMTTTLNVMAQRNGLSFSMVKYPFVKTGESWTSAPTILRIHGGDWHESARFYKSWAETWMPKPNPPEWMHRMNGWIIPNLKAQNGSRYRGVYSDLPQYFHDAHACGIDMVSIYGWEKQGFDNWYPEYDPDEGMGGEAGLKAAIAEIQKGGGKVNLYSQGQLIDPGTAYYRRIGYKQSAKDIWGGEYRENYGGNGSGTLLNVMRSKLFAIACPLAPGWYEQLVEQFKMARHYGVNGLMYDQIAGRPPYICFDNTHMHTKPSLAFGPGKLQNLIKLRDMIKAEDPDFAFLHELNVDVFSGIGDITQPVGYGFVPGPESFGEMFKYTFPDRIITNRTNSERKACFGYGFALQWRVDGMMNDTTNPEMALYLTRLNQLRTQYADLLLDGRFVDNEGFKSQNTNLFTYAYMNGGRMAITIWNPTNVPQKPAINALGYSLESCNWQNPDLTGTEHKVQPGDVALFIYEK